tara:strand:- start:801 stop:1235 length:435 start_codon:yes stop_codon:yes gene_type:complete
MPFKFNKELWDIGQTIEDRTLPLINKYFGADFKRAENNIWDILDFHDEDKKIICEIKGRRIKSTDYKETIITCNKLHEAFVKIELGYTVYLVFVFLDKTLGIQIDKDKEFNCCLTGTNYIKHYLIPIEDLEEIKEDEILGDINI